MIKDKNPEKILNKKMIERLIIINNLIKSGVYPNNKKIRNYYLEQTGYKVGEATIHRDIDCLRVYFKAPLEYDSIKKGYYYLDDNFDFALNTISVQDALYLSTAKTLLSNFEGTPLYKQIGSTIDLVVETQTSTTQNMLKRIAVPPLPKVVINESVWNTIVSSLQGNSIIEFDYLGRWDTRTKHRRVHPYQILLQDGMCFLFGYDEAAVDYNSESHKLGAERLFSFTRIKNLIATKDNFQLSENFDFTSRCSGGKFGAFMESDTTTYRIMFFNDARQYIKDCIWADDQKIVDDEEHGVSTITFTSSQSLKVREWVLSQGCNAKPLAPDWFVDDWKDQIQKMSVLVTDDMPL